MKLNPNLSKTLNPNLSPSLQRFVVLLQASFELDVRYRFASGTHQSCLSTRETCLRGLDLRTFVQQRDQQMCFVELGQICFQVSFDRSDRQSWIADHSRQGGP